MKSKFLNYLLAISVFGILAVAIGCGGSSSSPGNNTIATNAQNTVPVTVDAGPAGNYVNGVFTTVTVCAPGSAVNCQNIDGVLVDTGSIGLRVLSSALTISLPQEVDAAANPIAECNQFQDGYTWGPIKGADIKIAGEAAGSVPIQVIGDPAFSSVPTACTDTGLVAEDNLQALGANGILGVGVFLQDCGPACTANDNTNPGVYFACPAKGCVIAAEPLSQQVLNPVSLFASDNNGAILELPTISSSGVASTAGSLVFGIGTQSNNGLGSSKVFALDSSGNISTQFNNQLYPTFLDSGSNAIYFLDSTTTGVSVCSDNSSFYCPGSTKNLSAKNQSMNGTTNTVNFSVANADNLFNNTAAFAYNNLAGPNSNTFDFGLPFFFGRNVFTAIENQNTPAGPGPYFAY
jgi:hypothetical protein